MEKNITISNQQNFIFIYISNCLQRIQKTLKKEKNPEKKKELQYLLNRMVCRFRTHKWKQIIRFSKILDKNVQCFMLFVCKKQQELSAGKKEQQKRIERDWKKKEQSRVKEGKTPFYLKKCKSNSCYVFISVIKKLHPEH